MKIRSRRFKPFSEQAMFTEAACSEDPGIRRRAEQYVIDQLADKIKDQDDLDHMLAAIPDPEQRYIVLDALRPLLKFTPKIPEDDLTIYKEHNGNTDDR